MKMADSVLENSKDQFGIVGAVDHLEALFQKTESDLDYVENKLKMEIMNYESAGDTTTISDDSTKPTKDDPLKVMEELSTIKNEFGGIAKEFKDVQEQQKEFMAWFRSEMKSLGQMVTQIENHAGLMEGNADFNEQADALRQLGIDLEKVTGSAVTADEDDNSGSTQEDAPFPSVPECQPARTLSSDCVPVTENEFQSVSPLVRGRCQLDDVNQVYKQLHSLFKLKKQKNPITVQEMTELGMMVSGTTGQAKLKVLRSLKLISISSKGVLIEL